MSQNCSKHIFVESVKKTDTIIAKMKIKSLIHAQTCNKRYLPVLSTSGLILYKRNNQ